MKGIALWTLATSLTLGAAVARAQDGPGPRFDLGLRGNVVGANGVPSNDILGAGIFGHYHARERWWVGFALDHSPLFDVERPYEFLGLVGDPAAGEVDGEGTFTSLTAWLERVYARPGRRMEWFWGAGAGASTVDVDDVAGPLAGGGVYDIRQEVGTEVLLLASGGVRVRFGGRWAFETALRFDRHVTDWTATDAVSGRSVGLDDYTVRGVHLGLVRRF